MHPYLRIIRPNSVLKNVVFFVPAFFSRKLFITENIINLVLVSFGFYLISAAIYILNDIVDKDYDKKHPIKKNRPVASEQISVMTCFVLMMVCILSGVAIQIVVVHLEFALFFICMYLALNILYVYVLKNYKYVDVTCISVGFLIRASYGDFIIAGGSSDYLFICLFLIALILGFLKRYGDLKLSDHISAKSFRLVQYDRLELQNIIQYLIILLVVVFILYLNRSDTITALQGGYMLPGSILPIFAGFYVIGTIFDRSDTFDPIRYLLSDKVLLIIVFLFCSWYVNAIYF